MKTTNIGTFNYYAPEMWEKKVDENNNVVYNKGELTDLWALGITFFRLITGRYPYENATSVMKIKEFILNQEIDFSIIKNGQVKSLLEHMLKKDSKERATLQDIITSEWVTKDGTEPLEIDFVE